MSVKGSIKSLTINGEVFTVVSDNEPTLKASTEVTSIATSGEPIFEYLVKNPDIEGISIAVTADQQKDIDANVRDTVPLAITLASGDTYRSNGKATNDDNNMFKGIMDITLRPTSKWALV